jgi:alkylation response protein AidB-like acyl-CoA dehydrogenase
LPESLGGPPPDRAGLVRRYAKVAEGSLVAAFILTQHDAAVRRLVASQASGRARADDWLGRIARGEIFPTVGISQLTTSRRHGPRAMVASETSSGFVLDGAMPWVTAAERADLFVTGGVLDDGRQILAAVPRDRDGLSVRPAFDLAALSASRTSEIVCKSVVIDRDEVLAGPSMDVMATPGLAGTGGLETSALALGQARAALLALLQESTHRDDLIEPSNALADAWLVAARDLVSAADGRPDAPAPATIRGVANDLALRSTQAYLTARKGSGFLRSEAAQRWARQSLFFLVWSCPSPVANAAIRDLAGLCHL